MSRRPGDVVHVAFSKWDGRPHWACDGQWLGEDEHGVWVAQPGGTLLTRPGATALLPVDAVTVFPHDGPAIPTFHASAGAPPDVRLQLYVDMATTPQWEGDTVSSIDLDLDVVQDRDGRIEVLDEDEFLEHQVALGYPAEIITFARETCAGVVQAISAGEEPYATIGWEWLAKMR